MRSAVMTSLLAMKNKISFLIIFAAQMLVFVPASQASFLRFWRGFPKDATALEQFKNDLNVIFLPATGALARTSANLISYHPLLLPQYLIESEKLPVEMALVEYASEAEYRAYRETAEGQAYSNLHWDYFEKATSKSTVPSEFTGALENEKAYLLGKNIEWNHGPTFFYLFKNDAQMAVRLTKELSFMQKSGFKGVVLVAPAYVMIYAKSFLTPALARLLLWETTLRNGTVLKYGSGVQFPL